MNVSPQTLLGLLEWREEVSRARARLATQSLLELARARGGGRWSLSCPCRPRWLPDSRAMSSWSARAGAQPGHITYDRRYQVTEFRRGGWCIHPSRGIPYRGQRLRTTGSVVLRAQRRRRRIDAPSGSTGGPCAWAWIS